MASRTWSLASHIKEETRVGNGDEMMRGRLTALGTEAVHDPAHPWSEISVDHCGIEKSRLLETSVVGEP